MKHHLPLYFAMAFISSISLTGCELGSNSSSKASVTTNKDQVAILTTIAANYSSGATAIVDTKAPYTIQEGILPTISDISVVTYGDYFYRFEKFGANNITKFKIDEPSTPIWQYSTQDDSVEISSNPYTMIFVDDNKAYLLRYAMNTVWIVNPSANTSSEFKIGEIDLSAYDNDGAPEMVNGVIVDKKLFIAMQRLDTTDNAYAPQDATIAVIDTNTDQEIETKTGSDYKGIKLPIKNIIDMQFLEDDGLIYIQGLGRYGASYANREPEYDGGIATLDPSSFATQMILDDGDSTSHPYGLITQMQIISANRGYFVAYKDFGDNNLYSFNPITEVVDETIVANLAAKNIADIAMDQDKQLWVAINANTESGESAKLMIINPIDNSIIKDNINLELNPNKITFGSINQ